jgi:protein glucosyltransferase
MIRSLHVLPVARGRIPAMKTCTSSAVTHLVFFVILSLFAGTCSADTKDLSDFDKQISKLIQDARNNYNDTSFECKQDELYPPYRDQIQSDLSPWVQTGISKQLIEQAHKSKLGVKYQIIDNKLYRSDDCMFGPRCSGIEHFIHELLLEEDPDGGVGLPNMEFIVNVFDHPRVNKQTAAAQGQVPPPLFSFSTTDQYLDIMYPAWTFWEGGPAVWPIYPGGLGRWEAMRNELVEKAEQYQWNKKDKIGYFRGSRTSGERDPLILLSRARPELVDSAYTKNQAWKSLADTLGEEPVDPIPLKEHCRYAYLFNFRGVAASFRFKHLFLCNSLVFHIGDEWKEMFYDTMHPWVHYVPVSTEMEDVEQLLEYFMKNEDEAKRIAQAGYDFILHHLRIDDIKLYWKELLNRYAKLLDYEPTRDESLIEIRQLRVATTSTKRRDQARNEL